MWFHRFKQFLTSIASRVTIWYTGFMVIMLLAMFGATLWISARFVDADRKESLVEVVQMASHHADSPQDQEGGPHEMDRHSFEQGVTLAYYDQQNVSRQHLPGFFKWDLPQNGGTVSSYQEGDQSFLYYDLPLENGQGWVRGVIALSASSRELNNLLKVLAIAGPVLLVLMVLGGYWVLKRALKPIKLLDQTAHAIQTSGDLSQRIPLKGPQDELYFLARTMNGMLETVETSFEREKQFSHDVSHDLRTPVTVILSESEYGLRYADSLAEAQESHATIQRQALRMKDLINQILELSKLEGQDSLALKPLNLSDYLAKRQEDDQTLAQAAGKVLQYDLAPNLQIEADEVLLGRLVDNLLSNALKFAQSLVTLSLTANQEDGVILSIADDGPGIAEPEQAHIWQRFYQVDRARTKSASSGAGLGLSLVKAIADQHGALLSLKSQPGAGACFEVKFPPVKVQTK